MNKVQGGGGDSYSYVFVYLKFTDKADLTYWYSNLDGGQNPNTWLTSDKDTACS